MRDAVPSSWDRSVDVVVVGCGYAGAVAAISAHDAGAEVALFEKGETTGGISICSAGGVRVSSDAEAAFAYLQRTNGGTTSEDLLRVLAQSMTELPAYLEELAARADVSVSVRPAPGNYPFEGYESFAFVNVDPIPGFDPAAAYPDVRGAPEGARLFHLLERNLALRGIAPDLKTSVKALVIDTKGRVRGVRIEQNGAPLTVEAKRGVILATGGFEGSRDLQKRHWPATPVLNAAYRGNTGDGIRLAQIAGADLWHMFHYHGSYGFKHPDPAYPFGIRTKRLPDWVPGSGPRGDVRMPWILLDKRGRRFMNEYEPYMQDTGARPFERYDPHTQDFAALPAWMILDSDGIGLWPLGRPTSHEKGVAYEWSKDNQAEINAGIIKQAADLTGLARITGIDERDLQATILTWNKACRAETDGDWQRPPTSMLPIEKPPFYVAEVWPIVSNTQGGPIHDVHQRILDAAGQPIPGLYAAGELGSVFGHLYMSGGNIAECFAGGLIAGREAAGH